MWPPAPSALSAAASRPLRPQSLHSVQTSSASDLLSLPSLGRWYPSFPKIYLPLRCGYPGPSSALKRFTGPYSCAPYSSHFYDHDRDHTPRVAHRTIRNANTVTQTECCTKLSAQGRCPFDQRLSRSDIRLSVCLSSCLCHVARCVPG